MKRENLYIAQIGEAISLFDTDIYEYQRLSLILLDNIIEVMLKSRLHSQLYSYYRKAISYEEIDLKFKNLKYHESVTKESVITGLIEKQDKKVLDFCHEIRNFQYHSPYNNKILITKDYNSLIKFGIFSLFEFLIAKYINLNYSSINIMYPDKSSSEHIIYSKLAIKNKSQFILKMIERMTRSGELPSKILSDILLGDIELIEEFFENDANEDWNSLNKFILNGYETYIQDSLDPDHKSNNLKSFPKISSKSLVKYKESAESIMKSNTSKAIEKFQTRYFDIERILLGMKMYSILEEAYAGLND